MRHLIVVNGVEIELCTLGQPLDEVFGRLYGAYLGSMTFAAEELRTAALQYFDEHPTKHGDHNEYFGNFQWLWRRLLENGQHEAAEHIWLLALKPAWAWEELKKARHIHKGIPYYYWGITAILKGDIDRGYLLAHRALREDEHVSKEDARNHPAYALAHMDDTRGELIFSDWVKGQLDFLNGYLQDYRKAHGRHLKLSQVTECFLRDSAITEPLFLLAHVITRLRQLRGLPKDAVQGDFAGQLLLNMLFDIALIIEECIREKNPSTETTRHRPLTFINQAAFLLTKANAPLTNCLPKDSSDSITQTETLLGKINACFNGETAAGKDASEFERALLDSIDCRLPVETTSTPSRLQCDVAMAHGLRNHAGHTIAGASVIWERFDEIQAALFRMLFAAIEFLYVPPRSSTG